MVTSLISSNAVAVLSRMTGRKLSKQELTPSVIFLAALLMVLPGVMLVGCTGKDEEKQQWQKSINQFIFSEYARHLSTLVSKGVQQNQLYKKLNDLLLSKELSQNHVYKKTNELLTLTALLSESEKLLLISICYQMSGADGEIDSHEKKYLEEVAKRLRINPQYLAVLEAGFSHQGIVESAALCDVHSLLDYTHFPSLDALLVKAAKDILAALPAQPGHEGTQHHLALSYGHLKEFQTYRKQLDNLFSEVFQIFQDCNHRDFLSQTLAEEIEKVSQKLQSRRFRVAVIGEFSQGKSTLLNALLGEEIQPVRAIPCSSTITVLKYGAQKRVICRYKGKRQEEISFEQYQVKSAISEEAALGSLSDELAKSEIEEIIFEHPDLDLCRSGVEIVDSPGLNEHPERTAITQQLLKGTDAVIFLANASRPLTQGERDLMQDLKVQLNGGKTDEPAENLFVAVNFMDLLRREKDRQDVRQRLERFLQGQNIIIGENRVHFISAQAALDAILDGTEDEYLIAFQSFTQSIEKFLTVERGSVEVKQAVVKIHALIQEGLDELHQAEAVLDGEINLSEAEKQKILEQIGEASGRDVRICLLANELVDEVIEEVNTSWDVWVEELDERLVEKVEHWSSEHNAILSQEQLIQDYARQFNRDLSAELDRWIENQLKQNILKPKLDIFDNRIKEELRAIQFNIESINERMNAKSHNWVFCGEGKNAITTDIDILGNIGLAGLGAALLIPAVILAGPIVCFIGSLVGGGLLGTGVGNMFDLDTKVKAKVCEVGCERFIESLEDIFGKINAIIDSAFSEKVERADEIIAKAIFFYESILEQQEKAHKETQEQCEAEKAWIAQKRQELEQLQKNIKAIIPS